MIICCQWNYKKNTWCLRRVQDICSVAFLPFSPFSCLCISLKCCWVKNKLLSPSPSWPIKLTCFCMLRSNFQDGESRLSVCIRKQLGMVCSQTMKQIKKEMKQNNLPWHFHLFHLLLVPQLTVLWNWLLTAVIWTCGCLQRGLCEVVLQLHTVETQTEVKQSSDGAK